MILLEYCFRLILQELKVKIFTYCIGGMQLSDDNRAHME